MKVSTLDTKTVSVIIPVYNNSKVLEKCLNALQSQTYPQENFEVVVVDNASSEDISKVTQKFSQVILTHESKRGSYAARNRGITVAKGEIIAFTDSDCIPEADWLEQGVRKLMESQNYGLVAGKVELFFRNPDRPNAAEFYDAITFLDQRKNVEQHHFGATANVFTLAKNFQQIGMFNDDLKSSGDKEWGQRLASEGFQVVYVSDAVVKHPARFSIGQLYNKSVRLIGGIYQFQGNQASIGKSEFNFNRELIQRLKPPIKYFRWRLSDERLKGTHRKISFVLIAIFLNYAIALELINLKLGGTAKR